MSKLESNVRKVLICDDDRTHLLILNETLLAEGYEIKQALNGEDALAAYHEFSPDIILLDVNMPKLDGYQVCAQIRAQELGVNIPILMITGSDDQGSIEKAFHSGATDFLPKPIQWTLIKHRIRYMLRSFDYQSNLKSREKELQFLAYYDALTELPNRQYFTEQLTRSIAQAKRRNTTMAVMLIDLDNFKRINDTLGHSYGDSVLKEISTRLSSQLRNSDMVTREIQSATDSEIARLGGDEFTILLSDCGSSDEVIQIAKRVIADIAKPIVVEKYSLVVTASIGISICPVDGDNAADLLKFADIAMHEAKENDKDSYKLHSKDLQERSLNRLRLEEYMREALETNMFELFYQPQVNPETNEVEGAEALLRLHHKTVGIISPGEFIPVAEDTGLIVDMGYWVLNQACSQIVLWQNTSLDKIRISVNVSIKQVNQPDFVRRLDAILQETGANPALLEIELTESIIMKNPEENIGKLEAIKRLGVKLSIDDFGTGYSSLSYLKRFPLDTLKIDRSFVKDLSKKHSYEDGAIVTAIALMARALNLSIVVEGVETQDQLDCVNQMCGTNNTLIQGYFYSKPVYVSLFEEHVNSNAPPKLKQVPNA